MRQNYSGVGRARRRRQRRRRPQVAVDSCAAGCASVREGYSDRGRGEGARSWGGGPSVPDPPSGRERPLRARARPAAGSGAHLRPRSERPCLVKSLKRKKVVDPRVRGEGEGPGPADMSLFAPDLAHGWPTSASLPDLQRSCRRLLRPSWARRKYTCRHGGRAWRGSLRARGSLHLTTVTMGPLGGRSPAQGARPAG